MAELGFGIPLRLVVPPCASPLCSVTPYVVPLRRGRVLPAPCTAPFLLPARPRELIWMYVNGSKKDDAADEVPVAFMVRAADSDIAKEAIKEYISKQVVFYKRLHKVYFTRAIPKSASGKILRKELRAKLAVAANA